MTTSCEEDGALVGPVSLFCGVETWNWTITQFLDMATWAKQHGVSTLFIKVSEVGSTAGDIWYGGFRAWDVIYQELIKIMPVIAYAFPYGDQDIGKEVSIAIYFLQKYGKFCLDMEGARWSTPDAAARAKQFASALAPIPGRLWLSCPADPVRNNQLPFLQAMSPAVNIYMPMVYDDDLAGMWQPDFAQVNPQACLQPTLDLSQEFGANNVANIVQQMKDNAIHAISLWYEGFAKQNPTILDTIVAEMKGETMALVTHNGAVLDLQKSYQLDGNSQDKCGPWSVAELVYAGLPGHGPTGTAAQVQSWAHQKYMQYIGPDTASDQQGSSIENMHAFVKDAGLHWYDIPAIAPGSKQVDDIARLHRATDAGYPVLVTVNEQSIKRRDGSNPYPWQPRLGSVNHIFTVVGHTADGYLLIDDELNQGDGWPDHYSEASIECHWACVVQVVGSDPAHPWLAPIPGPDPLTWPQNFNAQRFTTQQKGAFPMTLPTGAKDNGKDTITFSNGHVMVNGFRVKYNDMAAKGLIPPDDLALENEHHEDAPEKNNPAFWPKGGNVQATRFFRFAWSAEHGVVVTYIGAELLWYQAHQAVQPPPAAVPQGTPQVVVDDISKLIAGFEQLKKDAGVV